MTHTNKVFLGKEAVPVFGWTKGVHLDDNTVEQAKLMASMPFIHKHVAVMPDAHVGIGSTVGTVIATKGAIIPAAVGVDIGCGMCAVQTNLTADQLPDSLKQLRFDLEAAIPHGRTAGGGKGDTGAWQEVPENIRVAYDEIRKRYEVITEKHPKCKAHNTDNHLGTLGGGNHFVELCLDEDDKVWVMLHSGSRGLGNRIGSYFIDKAKEEMQRYFISNLPSNDLSYLVADTEIFNDYFDALQFAQNYARLNRDLMMQSALTTLQKHFPNITTQKEAVNCHHNYAEIENHYGQNVYVTRKGAVRARKDDLGIIPGSMGHKSFIVRGLGSEASFCSCSHGAGRVMSRTEAKASITLDEHNRATEGVECRKDADVLDESPGAYKDIDKVMAAQSDLVSIEHTLKQVLCIKG